MKKQLEDNFQKYCSFSCNHTDNKKAGYAACYTQNIVYCKKYKTERNKGALCLDNNKAFQRIWKRKNRKKIKI